MFEHHVSSGGQYRSYRVAADEFELSEGDQLQPGGEIGIDVNSGATIYADYCGRVATVYYNPMSESLLVMLYIEHREDGIANSEYRGLVASRC